MYTFLNGIKAGGKLRYLPLLFVLLAKPLPTAAEITFNTKWYEDQSVNPVSASAMNLVTQVLHRLAADPKLANHPIRRYLYDPNLKAPIFFDNPTTLNTSFASNNRIFIPSNATVDRYIGDLIHEFLHLDAMQKFCTDYGHYGFLRPEDKAFLQLMDEAFAIATSEWARLHYPEFPRDRQVRYWQQQLSISKKTDAMENDMRAAGQSMDQISAAVGANTFDLMMTSASPYTLGHIPRTMADLYGQSNTFLVPEYAAYRERGDALLRYMWNHMASNVPFKLPPHMTYDYYRDQFMENVKWWSRMAQKPEDSILYWINFDAESAARARLARLPENERRYDYLSREDEARLNKILAEIDPFFIPVNTGQTYQRLWQEHFLKNQGR